MKLLFCPNCCSMDISLAKKDERINEEETFRCNHCKELFNDENKAE